MSGPRFERSTISPPATFSPRTGSGVTHSVLRRPRFCHVRAEQTALSSELQKGGGFTADLSHNHQHHHLPGSRGDPLNSHCDLLLSSFEPGSLSKQPVFFCLMWSWDRDEVYWTKESCSQGSCQETGRTPHIVLIGLIFLASSEREWANGRTGTPQHSSPDCFIRNPARIKREFREGARTPRVQGGLPNFRCK